MVKRTKERRNKDCTAVIYTDVILRVNALKKSRCVYRHSFEKYTQNTLRNHSKSIVHVK